MKNLDTPCKKCGALDYDPVSSRCRPCVRINSQSWRAKKMAEDPEAFRARLAAYAAKFKTTLAYRYRRRPRRTLEQRGKPSLNRRKYIKHRTPPWLAREQRDAMRRIYRQARDYSELAGEPYHVDHIVPLRGRTVSGLHVPWNLQVIRGADNLRKCNNVDHLETSHAL